MGGDHGVCGVVGKEQNNPTPVRPNRRGGRPSGGQTIGGNWTKNPDLAIKNAKVLALVRSPCCAVVQDRWQSTQRYQPVYILSYYIARVWQIDQFSNFAAIALGTFGAVQQTGSVNYAKRTVQPLCAYAADNITSV